MQHSDRIVHAEKAFATISGFEKPDVAVVGSGPAGVVVAISLAERGLRVLLLEAGGRHVDADATPYFDFVNDGAAHRVDYGLSMQIGGATNLWSGRSARFEVGDISKDRGWPIDQVDLCDHYRRAEDILGIRPPTEATVGQPPGWSSLFSGAMDLKRFVWSRPPRNMATVLSERLTELPGLVVVQGARCTGLNTHEGQVTSLTVRACGETLTVNPKRIVLAAGGLETARLLMASDIARNLPAVGRFLGTHPKHGVGHILLNRMVRLSSLLFVDTKLNGQWQRYGLGLSESARLDGLNHYV